MTEPIAAADSPPLNLSRLDALISKCYDELIKTAAQNAKLGDFLKMLELRRKLAPSDEDQRQFWNMLAQTRDEELCNTGAEDHPDLDTPDSDSGDHE